MAEKTVRVLGYYDRIDTTNPSDQKKCKILGIPYEGTHAIVAPGLYVEAGQLQKYNRFMGVE